MDSRMLHFRDLPLSMKDEKRKFISMEASGERNSSSATLSFYSVVLSALSSSSMPTFMKTSSNVVIDTPYAKILSVSRSWSNYAKNSLKLLEYSFGIWMVNSDWISDIFLHWMPSFSAKYGIINAFASLLDFNIVMLYPTPYFRFKNIELPKHTSYPAAMIPILSPSISASSI